MLAGFYVIAKELANVGDVGPRKGRDLWQLPAKAMVMEEWVLFDELCGDLSDELCYTVKNDTQPDIQMVCNLLT